MTGDTYAFGLLLRLTSTEAGGRNTALLGGSGRQVRFRYRPNWGLPGMTASEQCGAPVLGFSRENIEPGGGVRAVILPLNPSTLPLWAAVEPGMRLALYEGLRICGIGQVLWRRGCVSPLALDDETRFSAWLQAPDDGPAPE